VNLGVRILSIAGAPADSSFYENDLIFTMFSPKNNNYGIHEINDGGKMI
jgi:hypothetical protein